jgi:hypothetical protein
MASNSIKVGALVRSKITKSSYDKIGVVVSTFSIANNDSSPFYIINWQDGSEMTAPKSYFYNAVEVLA